MTAQLEGSETLYEFDNVRFTAERAIDLTSANIEQYAGSMVLAINYKDGRPTVISGPAFGDTKPENEADTSTGTFYVPTMVGRLATKHSETHFLVVPLSHDEGCKVEPPRLFAFGAALVKPAARLDTAM